jgi:hypothetical protein
VEVYMIEDLERARSWLRVAEAALTRRMQRTRSARERDDDFDEAVTAHRQAAGILEALQDERQPDAQLVSAMAPLHVETADLGILLSEIRVDEGERTEPIPRVWAD